MLKQSIKRILIIMLIISLLYANSNMAVLGLISYAIDETKTDVSIDQKQPNLEIQLSDICKNKMEEEETEYKENLELRINEDKPFSSIKISDTATTIKSEKSEEQEESLAKTFYKTTKINKEDLMRAIGETGSFVIKYYIEMPDETNNTKIENEVKVPDAKFPEQTTNQITIVKEDAIEEQTIENVEPAQNEENKIETKNEETEQTSEEPKGIIIAENNEITINTQTETDEEGYITVVYPEKTTKIEIEAMIEPTNILSTFVIENTKIIEKIADVDTIDLIEIEKEMTIGDEKETVSTDYKASSKIQYTQTKAELGIDKTQISSSVSNKINFTITMHTNREKYDLFKNPQFIIELPKEITNINIDKVTILNNEVFAIQSADKVTSSNGVPGILVKLEGEQTEHTKSVDEDIQIVIETTLTTENMIPTISSNVVLHYINENVKTYDGISNTNNGSQVLPMDIISNKEVMVKTETMVGENIVLSTKESSGEITIEPRTYNNAIIKETILNNLGEDIADAKILGTATHIGQIQGIDADIYYTEKENPTIDILDLDNGWDKEYTNNAKAFLIAMSNFAQGQELVFEFNMNLPQEIEDDIEHIVNIKVYRNNNFDETKTIIHQEAEHLDVFENESIKASIVLGNNKIEVGDSFSAVINIENISNQDIENAKLELSVPKKMKSIWHNNTLPEGADIFLQQEDGMVLITNLNIRKGEKISLNITGDIKEYVEPKNTVKASFKSLVTSFEVSKKLNIIAPSVLETAIISNKPGQVIKEGETVEYKIRFKNNGESHLIVNVRLSDMPNMNIQRMETTNLMTGENTSCAAVSLSGEQDFIQLDPGEVVEMYIIAQAKATTENTINTMYATIQASKNKSNIAETARIVNTIKASEIKESSNSQVPSTEPDAVQDEPEVQAQISNTVKGVAWIDRNENGVKDENETILKGVQAILIDTTTSKEIARDITNNKGEYEFDNVDDGKYVVEFKYNLSKFDVTNYKNETTENKQTSSAIVTTQGNQTTAKTEALEVKEGKTENLNVGFVFNKTFDMSINKGITKVSVSNESGTTAYEFNNNSMAKVEIDGKLFKNSMILVEYEIAVTNMGETEGYAKVISDEIPEGMEFSSELNPNWYDGKDGTLYCEALMNKNIQPGETATVKLILVKEMTEDKVTTVTNSVKLEETFNEYLIEDKNKNNNTSEATLIVSLTTGQRSQYMWLIITVIAILGIGIFGVIRITNKMRRE